MNIQVRPGIVSLEQFFNNLAINITSQKRAQRLTEVDVEGSPLQWAGVKVSSLYVQVTCTDRLRAKSVK